MIRIGIYGYGNLGRGIESEIKKNEDMELVAIFTRRDPSSIKTNSDVPVISSNQVNEWTDKIDVMILCGGSVRDLPVQAPELAKYFNIIDSFDTHIKIIEHFENVNDSAVDSSHTAIISVGWDPGMFSLNRLYAECILHEGKTYTFWGKGISQGHSNAIRRVAGVKDGRQYTIPVKDAIRRVRNGENPELSERDKHKRECFVVAEEGADLARIEKEIKEMPAYFNENETVVHFISEEELIRNHSELPHGGFVIRSGETGNGNKEIIEYSLKLDSNPEFSSSVLLTYARACYRLANEKNYGAKTVLDIPPKYLSSLTDEELRARFI